MFEGLEKRQPKRGSITYWKDGVMVYKRCNKCKEIKLVENFHRRGNGYTNKCIECTKKYNKENAERYKQYQKQYRKNNAEHIKELGKQYREKNKEHIKERMKKYNKENAERHKLYYKENAERYKQYRKDNAEHIKEYIKQRYKDKKEVNLQDISNMLGQINPIFKNLPIYGYIYKIENIKTGHVYIGQTTNPLKERYKTEKIAKGWINERKYYKTQKFLDELIEEDFVVTEVLDVAFCQYHLDKLEAHYIDKYDSYNNGYNNNAGHHDTTDGLEEFNKMLEDNGLKFVDGKIIII